MALSKTLVFNVTRCEPQLIVPEKSTPHEIKHLSDIDDQHGLRFLIPLLFLFPPQVGGKSVDPVNMIRNSLAKALVFYYPFAGRIFEGPNNKLMVDCNAEGVMFVEANANVTLDQISDEILPPCSYMEKFLFELPNSAGIVGCPLLFLQVTRFVCGGFSLGIWLNHTMTDGIGIMQLLNTMSELINGASTPSIPPVWQRELLSARTPPKITRTHNEYPLNNMNIDPDQDITYPEDTFIRTSVFFSPDDIEALRSQLPTAAQTSPPSRFDLVAACIWKCRTIALSAHRDDIVRFSMLIDVRKKMLEFPMGYYGNAIVYPAAKTRAGTLCNSPLAYAVDLIRRVKAQMDEEYVRSVADFMVMNGRPKYVSKWNYIVSDLTKLGFDELVFRGTKPLFGGVVWATSVISFCSVWKNNIGEDKGVVIPICLPSSALQKFQREIKKTIAMQKKGGVTVGPEFIFDGSSKL